MQPSHKMTILSNLHTTTKKKGAIFQRTASKSLPKADFTLKDFCERLTSHGVIDCYQANSNLAKIFWFILVLLSVAVAACYVYDEVNELLEAPILTTVSFKPQSKMPIPLVYICPINFVHGDYIRKCSYAGSSLPQLLEKTKIFDHFVGLESILQSKGSYWQDIVTSPKASAGAFENGDSGRRPNQQAGIQCPDIAVNETHQEYLFRIAITVPMFFRECSFGRETLDCNKIAKPVLDREYGVCFLVNVTKLDGTRKFQTTRNLALNFLLDLQTEQILDDDERLVITEGAVVRLFHSFDPSTFGGTLISPGTNTKFSMIAKKLELISFIESLTPQQCTESDQFKFKLLRNVEYSQDACRMDCSLRIMLKGCKCILPVDYRFLNMHAVNATRYKHFCRKDQMEDCVKQSIEDKYQKEFFDCSKECFRACKSFEIDIESSHSKFPSNSLLRRLEAKRHLMRFNNTNQNNFSRFIPTYYGQLSHNDLYNLDRWKNNLIVLDISYKNLEYIETIQTPSKSIALMVANIGGHIGLWTGASIFTVIQLPIFACYLLYSSQRQPNSIIP